MNEADGSNAATGRLRPALGLAQEGGAGGALRAVALRIRQCGWWVLATH